MGSFKVPKFQKPTRESLGLTNYVSYAKYVHSSPGTLVTESEFFGLLTVWFSYRYDPHSGDSTDARKSLSHLDYSPLRRVTWESFWMGMLVSMGGFIFGYDTGQISGFLAMPDFLNRFGQHHSDGTAYFSNVRSGLIVAMVSHS